VQHEEVHYDMGTMFRGPGYAISTRRAAVRGKTRSGPLRAFAASAWGRSESAASPSCGAAGTGGKSVHLKEIRDRRR
jgi:hypothetical protein